MIKKLYLFIIISLFSLISEACEIPVFRYALERWNADPYRLQVYVPSGQSLSDVDQKRIDSFVLESFKSGGDANFSIEELEKDHSKVTYELLYPLKSGIIRPVISGDLKDLKSKLILSSPSRSKLEKFILSGKSIVWVIIPSDDPVKSEDFKKALKARVSKALSSVKLSDGIIKKENTKNEKLSKEELENILHSQIPLELSFELIEIDRNDQRESVFIDMLLRQNPQLMDYKGSIAFPVFGRGRVLDGVTDVNNGELEELTVYLSSHCSCTVKEENPGIDLLMVVPWADYVAESQLQFRDVLPPLSGLVSEAEVNSKQSVQQEEKGTSILSYLLTVGGVMLCFILFFLVLNRSKGH